MGYSPYDHKKSNTTEVTEHACRCMEHANRGRCNIEKIYLKSSLPQEVQYYRMNGLLLTCRVGDSDTSKMAGNH